MTTEQQSPELRADGASPVSEVVLRPALDQIVLENVRPAALVLSVLYILLALGHTRLPPSVGVPMLWIASLSAVALACLRWILAKRMIPIRWAHLVGAAIAGVVLLNSLAHLSLSRDPLQTTNLALLVIGAGLLYLSWRWFAATVIVTLLGWLGIVILSPSEPTWAHFGFVLVSATALAFVVHAARLNAYRRFEILRLGERSRAEAFRKRALQLEALITVGRSINATSNLDDLLQQVISIIHEQFAYAYVGVFLITASRDHLIARAGSEDLDASLLDEEGCLPLGEAGLIGSVVEQREWLYVSDVLQETRPGLSSLWQHTRSELALPLIAGDEVLGVLDIASEAPDAFTREDIRVFASLSDQVATAIRNIANYQSERSRRLLAETLYEVGRALSQTLDQRQVLDLLLVNLGKLVSFDRGAVLLEQDGALEIVAALGFPPVSDPLEIRVSIKEDDVFQQIYRTKSPLVVAEIQGRSDWQNVESLPPARSWIGVPLIDSAGIVIGMLSLTRERPVPFTEDETKLAEAFAGQAAVALQNAHLYSELARAFARLERLDRTKSDFISVASHELRTPLTLLKGYSHMLADDPRVIALPDIKQMIDAFVEGAARLGVIVERMIDVAEIDSQTLDLEFAPVSLGFIIDVVSRDFAHPLQERHLSLKVEALDTLPAIEGDGSALSSIFHHLVLNAIKYTPDGGVITIRGRQQPMGYRGLPEPSVEITVSDTGIGISQEDRELIFEKFYQTGEVSFHSSGTTKFRGGGPGLGLAIVKGLVTAHHGLVWVESHGYDEKACPGSTFHVALPVRQTG